MQRLFFILFLLSGCGDDSVSAALDGDQLDAIDAPADGGIISPRPLPDGGDAAQLDADGDADGCHTFGSPTYESCKVAALACGVRDLDAFYAFCEARGGMCDGPGAACSDGGL